MVDAAEELASARSFAAAVDLNNILEKGRKRV